MEGSHKVNAYVGGRPLVLDNSQNISVVPLGGVKTAVKSYSLQ
jgi:hypothetical protein